MADKRKRVLSSSETEHSSTRRKANVSDESNTSGDTQTSASTRATTIEPTESLKMVGGRRKPPPPEDFCWYYADLPGRPMLLARSSNEPWVWPKVSPDPDSRFTRTHAEKRYGVVRNHPLRKKLDDGLRTSIHKVLSTMTPREWISVDYIRMGYEANFQDNPVVIWVTVEEGQVGYTEAKRVADEIKVECLKVDLDDAEVEIKLGKRAEYHAMEPRPSSYFHDEPLFPPLPEPLLDIMQYPLVGSSLSTSNNPTGTGTLGGYIIADGSVYAITNHHVLFGLNRKEAFPLPAESAASILVEQPGLDDLEREIENVQMNIKTMEDHCQQIQVKALEERLQTLNQWRETSRVLGTVTRTSGESIIPSPIRRSADWGIVKVGDPERDTLDTSQFFNKLPIPALVRKTNIRRYIEHAFFREGYDGKPPKFLPIYLKRHLTLAEMRARHESADLNGKSFIAWKHGRTTHTTYGIVSEIDSDYARVKATEESPAIISTEVLILDDGRHPFSGKGDSGSWMWDSDGYVLGMFWGRGDDGSNYATPMETILDDIKSAMGFKDIKLVVRKEDEDNTVFQAPPRMEYRFGEDVETGPPVPSLFDDDDTEMHH